MPDRIRVVQAGAGAMGRTWLRTVHANPDVELVGLVDLLPDVARQSASDHGYTDLLVSADLDAVLATTRPDALINVTVPAAHRLTSETALAAGAAVLCEKPIADSVAEAWSMVDAAERSGRLLMVSQSRRYFRNLTAYRKLVAAISPVGTVACQFFKAPRIPGFREEMAEPLLVDMAIHQFDLARLLTGSDPLTVSCDAYNPPWSWFAGNAAADATFAFADGVRFNFSGSWVAAGAETSWNGSWRVVGARGTALWDGDNAPIAELADGSQLRVDVGDEPEETAGSLAEFVRCLRTGNRPDTEAARNIVSLAMVEAAVHASNERRIVVIDDVLADARGRSAAYAAGQALSVAALNV